MSASQSLQSKLMKGGLLDISDLSESSVLDVAQHAGLAALVADCDRARSLSAILRAVAKAVDFPEFFGSDLEALYDCLCDTVSDQDVGVFLWFAKLHTGDNVIAEHANTVLQVCNDVAEYAQNNDKVFSFYIEHSGRHPEED